MSLSLDRLQELYIRFYPKITLALIRRFNIERESAEDAVQESFARLIESFRKEGVKSKPNIDDENHLSNYLLKASLHRCIDRSRHSNREIQDEAILLQSLDPSSTPEAWMLKQERFTRLHEAVARLREPYFSIFRLLLKEELSLAEVARRLRTNPGSIYIQFQRGCEAIKEMLITRGDKAK